MSPTDPEVPSNPREPRRWRIPPAVRSNRETLPGEHILGEILAGSFGLLLWESWRDVELWADVSPEQRLDLFCRAAIDSRLALLRNVPASVSVVGALRTIASITEPRQMVEPLALASACQAVSTWAGGEGHSHVAVAFAQAAALVVPDDPAAAYEVGRAARRAAEYAKAESWYHRALGLARRKGAWETYGLAYVGIGHTYWQRGAIPAARRALLRALRAARKHGLWSVRAMALHDLFCIAANGKQYDEAERLARLTLRAYGKRHPRLPAFAHDVALAWVLQGRVGRAIRVFRALVDRARERPLRLLYLSSLARASGDAGERGAFIECWVEAFSLLQIQQNMEYAPDSLVNLARGAAALGDTERTEVALQYARAVALHRREAHARLVAEEMLASLAADRLDQVADRIPAELYRAEPDELSNRFVAALAASPA